MIRLGFCSVDQIAWSTPMASRMQHILLYMQSYNIDVLNLTSSL